MKTTPGHLKWDEMPEADKFKRLAPSRKQLIDTVKMSAYRAETAMASIVRETLAPADDAHSLLRDLFRSEADLVPDALAGGASSPRFTSPKLSSAAPEGGPRLPPGDPQGVGGRISILANFFGRLGAGRKP